MQVISGMTMQRTTIKISKGKRKGEAITSMVVAKKGQHERVLDARVNGVK